MSKKIHSCPIISDYDIKDVEIVLFDDDNTWTAVNTWDYAGISEINFCPFCGEKLPKRIKKYQEKQNG